MTIDANIIEGFKIGFGAGAFVGLWIGAGLIAAIFWKKINRP